LISNIEQIRKNKIEKFGKEKDKARHLKEQIKNSKMKIDPSSEMLKNETYLIKSIK
jgi:hypothetical protein